MSFTQGDIIKIAGFKTEFLIISKNSFINAVHMFHVCPLLSAEKAGPLHITVTGNNGSSGTAICEQIKLIDPAIRNCRKTDWLPYGQIMEISDAIQGMFEYD